MFTKITLIAQIQDPRDFANFTYYFFSNKHKILLPIEIKEKYIFQNSLIDTLLKTLKYFKIHINKVLVYMYKDSVYYCYLCFEKLNKTFEVNCSLYDFLNIYNYENFEVPVYIKKSVIRKCGIKITKKLLVRALEDDFYYTNDALDKFNT